MPDERIICPKCGQPCSGLYESRRGGLMCYTCLDAQEPETVDRYDGWRDRELLREKRRSLALHNFCVSPPA